jgi:hypothetical protein
MRDYCAVLYSLYCAAIVMFTLQNIIMVHHGHRTHPSDMLPVKCQSTFCFCSVNAGTIHEIDDVTDVYK